MIRHYSKEGLTVIWKPDLCQHSKHCWKELAGVFDPKKSPWIDMDGATREEIMEQVKKCPSGALSFELTDNKMPS